MVGLLMQLCHDQAGFTRYGSYDVFQLEVSSLGCVHMLLGKKHVSNVAQILQDPHVARQLDLAGGQAIHSDTCQNLLEHPKFNDKARWDIHRVHIKHLSEGR
jgi:hypothetical protein